MFSIEDSDSCDTVNDVSVQGCNLDFGPTELHENLENGLPNLLFFCILISYVFVNLRPSGSP